MPPEHFCGNSFVKYFSSIDYQHEGDIHKKIDMERHTSPSMDSIVIYVRTNLDFNLTKSTVLTATWRAPMVYEGCLRQDSWETVSGKHLQHAPDIYYPRIPRWMGILSCRAGLDVNSLTTMGNNGVRKPPLPGLPTTIP